MDAFHVAETQSVGDVFSYLRKAKTEADCIDFCDSFAGCKSANFLAGVLDTLPRCMPVRTTISTTRFPVIKPYKTNNLERLKLLSPDATEASLTC